MKGNKRVGLFALPVLAAALALLSLPGGAYARANADQALAVAVDGPGTVSGTGISCRDGTGDCVEIYTEGTSVTLTATADSGATFTGWGGDCSAATGNTCTLTMNSAKAVTATFATSTNPTLTVTASGNGKVTGPGINCGSGSTDCSESYAPGTAVTLTETPSSGATFTGWGGACSGTGTTCNVTMSSSQSVTATFSGSSTSPTLTVTVTGNGKVTGPGINCGSGSTDCSEPYASGTTVTLTEAPNTGATFSGWGGSCGGTGTTCTVIMNTAKSVTATFSGGSSGSQFGLSVTVTGSGQVSGPGINCGSGNTDCSELYAPNTLVTLTASPASGATFAGWGGNCSGTNTTCTLTMNAAKAVAASFSQGSTQKILTVSVGGSGRVTGTGIACGAGAHDCSNAYNNNGAVTLTATPTNGAVFLGWGGACTGTGRVCQLVMDQPKAVSASFSTPGRRAPSTFAARSLGRPIVARTSVGWAITLRFHTSRSAAALLRLTRGGRFVNAFTFNPRVGNVLVGPFNVSRQGPYRFRLTLSDGRGGTAQLIWDLCLGSCGGSFVPATSFVASSGATLVRTSSGALMIKARFRASGAGAASVRVTVGGRLVSTGNFTFRRGPVTVDVPVRVRGLHHIVMTARSASGRTVQLVWNVRI